MMNAGSVCEYTRDCVLLVVAVHECFFVCVYVCVCVSVCEEVGRIAPVE